jgi:hypothetical protein
MLNESCLHCGMRMSYMTCFQANISSLASSILSVALNMSYIMTTNFSKACCTPISVAYGDKKLLYVKWKPKALHTGIGRSKMTCGKCFGQYFRQLLRVANSLRIMAARLNSVAGASTIAILFLFMCIFKQTFLLFYP